MVKNKPANAGDVRDMDSLLGPGASTGGRHGAHSSILAWRIPWSKEPGAAASQASLSFTISEITQNYSKFMSIESVMPPNHLSSVISFSSCLQSSLGSGSF